MSEDAPIEHIGVIGAGAWGTALAATCARAGRRVTLQAHEGEVVEAIGARRENTLFLPGVRLSDMIAVTGDLAAIGACDAVLAVAPAQHLRAVLTRYAPAHDAGRAIVLCAKGIERDTGKLMSEVLTDAVPSAAPAVLSGPSFAIDVARGLPTAVTLACEDPALGGTLAAALGSPAFRPYLANDLIGAEVGGAVKNVLAIAAGIVEGRELGKSAHAALIARGFAEMTRLAVALGAQAETLAGLCGLGDLVLTCSSTQSRNMSCGVALGRGETLDAILSGRLAVTEGVTSAPAVIALARRHHVEMPICEAVAAVIAGRISVDAAIGALLSRPLTSER